MPPDAPASWHALPAGEVFTRLGSAPAGLAALELGKWAIRRRTATP